MGKPVSELIDCPFCGKQNVSGQTNAHAIPKFLIKGMKGNKNGNSKLDEIKSSPNGIEIKHLHKEHFAITQNKWCVECEIKFSNLERYFSNKLHHNQIYIDLIVNNGINNVLCKLYLNISQEIIIQFVVSIFARVQLCNFSKQVQFKSDFIPKNIFNDLYIKEFNNNYIIRIVRNYRKMDEVNAIYPPKKHNGIHSMIINDYIFS